MALEEFKARMELQQARQQQMMMRMQMQQMQQMRQMQQQQMRQMQQHGSNSSTVPFNSDTATTASRATATVDDLRRGSD